MVNRNSINRNRSRLGLSPLQSSTTFLVTFVSHCAMSAIPIECDDMEEAREVVAGRLRRARRRKYGVYTLDKGKEWEISEPEDAMLVPDDAGVLSIEEVETEYDEDED